MSAAARRADPRQEGFDPSWRSFAAVQGGLAAGYMLHAAAADVVGGSSRTSTTHFLGPVVPGRAVSTEVLPDRTARTSSRRVELRQGGSLVAVAQGLPTVELTIPLARTPPAAGARVRIRQRTTWLDDEVAVDDAVMHDEAGRLTAVVRRTRRTLQTRLTATD